VLDGVGRDTSACLEVVDLGFVKACRVVLQRKPDGNITATYHKSGSAYAENAFSDCMSIRQQQRHVGRRELVWVLRRWVSSTFITPKRCDKLKVLYLMSAIWLDVTK